MKEDVDQQLSKLNPQVEEGRIIDPNSKMLVVFPVGNEEYAMEIDAVREVVPAPPISKIPQAEKHIKGVSNVRGNVLAIIELSRKFGLYGQNEKSDMINYVIVMKSEDIKIAVASSLVPETFLINENQINSSTDVLRKSTSEQSYIKGIIKRDNRMIILIDVLEMVQSDQQVNN